MHYRRNGLLQTFCSGDPYLIKTSMLPVSGAEQLNIWKNTEIDSTTYWRSASLIGGQLIVVNLDHNFHLGSVHWLAHLFTKESVFNISEASSIHLLRVTFQWNEQIPQTSRLCFALEKIKRTNMFIWELHRRNCYHYKSRQYFWRKWSTLSVSKSGWGCQQSCEFWCSSNTLSFG